MWNFILHYIEIEGLSFYKKWRVLLSNTIIPIIVVKLEDSYCNSFDFDNYDIDANIIVEVNDWQTK